MSLVEYIRRKIKGNKYDSDTYIQYLRRCGIRIGDNTRFYNVEFALVDTTRPYLIEIGDNVKLTKGITILTHDYAWSVLKNKYGNVMGNAGKVIIGNNVFIGVNTTILKGVTIGDNVIIGAGSVVSKDIPSDCVAIGSPAKPIMTLDAYYEKRLQRQAIEAEIIVSTYRNKYGKDPDENELKDFFWLYTDSNDELNELYKKNMKLCGSETISYLKFGANKKKYSSFEEMLKEFK